MDTITKSYNTAEIEFTIELEQPMSGRVSLPYYANVPDGSRIEDIVLTILETEFDEDMQTLVPKSFGGDWAKACLIQLQKRVQAHIDQFSRILPSDLECYVAQMVLVMSSIGKEVNQPISHDDGKSIFKNILIDVSNKLNVPITMAL